MGRQVQIWEIRPESRYVAASQFGPTYSGPLAALTFEDGVAVAVLGHPREYVLGRELKGAGGLSHIWEYVEGFELRWAGDCWEYEPKAVKPVLAKEPSADVPEVDPQPTDPPKRKRGRPRKKQAE